MRILSLVAAAIAFAGVALGVGYCAGRRDGRVSLQEHQAKAAIDTAQRVRAAAAQTVLVHVPAVNAARAESDRLAELVAIADAATLSVRLTPASAPQLLQVPEVVVRKIRADSVTIARQAAQILRLHALVRSDSNVINRQAFYIQKLERKRRCGPKCGGAIVIASVVGVKYGGEIADAVARLIKRP